MSNNWFNKRYADRSLSRLFFNIEAHVWVPTNENEEEEKNIAKKVLRTMLTKIEGNASMETAVDSNIMFYMQSEPEKIR